MKQMAKKVNRKPRRPMDPVFALTFGQRMEARIDQLGKSVPWLAGEVGTSAASIFAYKAGTTIPGLDVADKIARALDVPLDWLTGRKEAL